MRKLIFRMLAPAVLLGILVPGVAAAQAPPPVQAPPAAPAAAQGAVTPCKNPIPVPAAQPPAGSGTVLYMLELCFSAQGNVPVVEAQTYLYYMQLRGSQASQGIWVPYDEKAEQTMRADFTRLWATNFLDDLRIETSDYTFANGTPGKIVTYHMEERERVKIVNYEGSKQIDRTKIDEQLRERGIELRLDSFLDDGVIRRIKTVLREMMAEKGFTNATVEHTVTPVAGGPKLVNVTFNVGEGPKIKIRDVEFIGNTAKSDGTLQKKMKENKPKGLLGLFTGGGTYQEAKFEEDADKIMEYYQNEGYVRARIGQPELKVLEDSDDGKERWIQLRIPVTEGYRYRIGEFNIEGNTVVNSAALRPLFKVTPGDWYKRKDIVDGLRKAQEIYGAGGYMDFTGFPDLKPSDEAAAQEAQVPAFLAAVETNGGTNGAHSDPTVDVTMRLTEGKQFFVNRIVFTGNTTTRDNVIRREMRLVEGGVFNTESLKYSIRRLNQLGYFEQINEQDQRAMKVDKTPGRDNAVDVTLALKEQNRNQLTFGAGVSQYEGFFGQLAFQTANFLGRGESLTVSMQAGDRAQNYQLAFTEPFLFDRNITGGFDVYKRALQYVGYYTQKSTGGNLMFGFPVADFSRMFVTYSYEQVRMTDLNELFLDPNCIVSDDGCGSVSLGDLSSISPDALERVRRNPFVFDSLLIGAGGRRTVSKVTPSFVHNTIDNPIFPNQGKRYTAAIDLAVLGGNTQFYKPRLEGIWYRRHLARTSFGVRAQTEYIAPVGTTEILPIFEKLFMGGEYSVRGFDIRSIGPSDPETGLVIGGNKSLLFNGEYLISIANPVRLILFYDAGQVVDEGQQFAMKNFKTSTGVEVRFFMPVLNVPFRLIFAHNPQREGVLDNNFQPAKEFVFRFAVGSTF
ncbi:MAG TPA: BamA/TamA family outer membrane protein [Vicinamibacterales bacterium]